MAKILSWGVFTLLGAILASTALIGVVSSQTAAPKHNPVGAQIVDYGSR